MTGQQLYSTAELSAMNAEDLRVAQANGFVKPLSAEEATAQKRMGEAIFGEGYQNPTLPSPVQGASLQNPDRYAVTSWGTDLYDFVTPSGQRCQMRKLQPEALIGTNLLDRVTRLPAFAEENIRKAEGKPPASALPDKEALQQLVGVLNDLLPMVVVQPKLWPDPEAGEERVPGRVYVSMVELGDRVAIMERAVGGVSKMDNFRQEP